MCHIALSVAAGMRSTADASSITFRKCYRPSSGEADLDVGFSVDSIKRQIAVQCGIVDFTGVCACVLRSRRRARSDEYVMALCEVTGAG